MKRELLYSLLPRVHRQLDAESGFALRALLGVIDESCEEVERSIDRLYDDWFIETCRDDVIARIAQLVGVDGPAATRMAAANSIAARSRKGTAMGLEGRIADVLGWSALVEPASAASAKAQLRLWRQNAYPVCRATPFRVKRGCYTFHPLGVAMPLLNVPAPRRSFDRPNTFADMPFRITAEDADSIQAGSIRIETADPGKPPVLLKIRFASLADWDAEYTFGPAQAIVDPERGRFVVRADSPRLHLLVSYAYGFSADMGGGPYPRGLAVPAAASGDASSATWIAFVHHAVRAEFAPLNYFTNLNDALQAFRHVSKDGIIRILDSATYSAAETLIGAPPLPGTPFAAHRRLTVEAESGEVPCIRGNLAVHGPTPGLAVTLSGLWLDGPLVADGHLSLHLNHCTVRPGPHGEPDPAQTVAQTVAQPHRQHGIHAEAGSQPHLQVRLSQCIVGAIRLPQTCQPLHIIGSIVDGAGKAAIAGPNGPGPITHLDRSTVLGPTEVVEQETTGCDLVADLGDVRSAVFGHPDYARRRLTERQPAAQSQTDGAGQAVSGAFRSVAEAGTHDPLQRILDEFVPAGLQLPKVFES